MNGAQIKSRGAYSAAGLAVFRTAMVFSLCNYESLVDLNIAGQEGRDKDGFVVWGNQRE